MPPNIIDTILKKFSQDKSFILTKEHKQCLEILENTNQNLFITGKAGTGKSMLIQYFRENTKKKVVVLAPTGLAALNARGQTIHSFFELPPCVIEIKALRRQANYQTFAEVDCLVIDEISMVRPDLLDGVDRLLRLNGKDKNLPFGGTQMVFVGDLYQLPPVVTENDWPVFNLLYDSPYFFNANSFKLDDFSVTELKTIFRQREIEFINFLNKVRTGEASIEDFELINKSVFPKPPEDHIVLCTINKTANTINQEKLSKINEPQFTYQAVIEDDFPTENRNLPAELELKLKKGARVLFVKNDPARRWINGTLGEVVYLDESTIRVKIDNSGKEVEVGIEEWNNVKYAYNQETGQWEENIIGKLKQYPLRLAWAITIHKSQGMSLERVCLDFSQAPFAHGQTYVALSRCRTLAGLALTRKIWPNDVLIDERIIEFHRRLSDKN